MSRATTPPQIPLLDVARQTASIRQELDSAIAGVLDHSQFILGPEVQAFEESIARYCGAEFAVSCASGSDAILLPLMALKIGPGDKVVTTPFSFFATAGAIARLGATPVFLDIDPATYNLNPCHLAAYLDSCSAADIATVKAILPVHLFGQCADMDAINSTAARFGIPVIEDAAQALGASYKTRRAGSLGWCAAFSFFPSKNLGAMGDGGIVTTNDESLAARLRILRGHGADATYYHSIVGINSRLDTIQAAILSVKLRYLDKWTSCRRANANTYSALIAALPAAGLNVTLPTSQAGQFHIYNQFTIRVPGRDSVRRGLAGFGVASAIYYPLPLHLQECFAHLGYRPGDLPHSETAAREVLSLPIEPGLTPTDVAFVVEQLERVLKSDSCQS